MVDFWIDFGAIWEAQAINSSHRRGMRGAWLDSFEFKEFEDNFENPFRHAPTLRVAADLIASRIPPDPVVGVCCSGYLGSFGAVFGCLGLVLGPLGLLLGPLGRVSGASWGDLWAS